MAAHLRAYNKFLAQRGRKPVEYPQSNAGQEGIDEEEVQVTAESLLPAQIEIYNVFCELSSTRPWNNEQPLRIPFSEVHAWASLTYSALQPWELEAIRRLDHLWLKTHGEAAKAARAEKK